MMAAAQPFVSGAISKTVNMPADATIADVAGVYDRAHTLGIKAVALYRDGSKLSQPLSSAVFNDVALDALEDAENPSRVNACQIAAQDISKRRALAVIKFICIRASLKTAAWARFSLICIRKARPFAAL